MLNKKLLTILTLAGLGAVLPAVHARSTGPPAARTGSPMDPDGLSCTACHRTFAPANSDPRGLLMVQTVNYKPGIKQTIRIHLEHPTAQRWGFQLTARALNDPPVAAGTFTGGPSFNFLCIDNTPAPCNGKPEFISHNATSTFVGKSGSAEWEVEWTPPTKEVGDIMLYAAGNAANNGGTSADDYIFTTSLRIKSDGTCGLSARPTVRSITDAAAYLSAAAANGMASLFGTSFQQTASDVREAGPGDIDSNSFPNALGCIAIDVDGKRAPVTFVRFDQVNFQVPTLTRSGTVPVRLVLNPDRPNQIMSDVVNMTVADYSPAFFTFDGKSIKGRTADFSILADPAVVPGGVKAKPGDVVMLYATGFNVTSPVWQAGELAAGLPRLSDSSLRVTIGGTTLAGDNVMYAGLAPGSISALYQFNVRIPLSVPDGNVPVSISIGGVSTQAGATIPVQR